MDFFSGINWLAVIVAAIAGFAFGALWYSPALFSKAWQKEVGMSEEDLKGANMFQIFGTSFLLMFVMAFGMAHVFGRFGAAEGGWMEGAMHGLMVGVLFVAPSIGINILYQRKSLKLWLIDSGYQLLFLVIVGAILGAWK